MGEQPDIAFMVAYECPHCRASLESRTGPADAWVRCPRCRRASQPPAEAVILAPFGADEDVLVIGPAPGPRPMTPVRVGLVVPRPTGRSIRVRRVACASALIVSGSLLPVSVVNPSARGVAVLGLVAVAALLLLVIPARV